MRRSMRGFTIVELLIVIVVIAILAAITLVAYNGIQARANNTKTINTVNFYIKALNLYKIDNGDFPYFNACLGIGYPAGKCRSDWANGEDANNINSVVLAPYYKGSPPTPSTKSFAYNATLTITGIFYIYNGTTTYNPNGGAGIGVMFESQTDCPTIGGTSYVSKTVPSDNAGILCRYAIN